MAGPSYTGVPEVAAREEVPEDYQHVQASPEAFGAGVGEALHQAGQKLQGFYDENAANQALNNYERTAQALINGDPSKQVVVPDGQTGPDMGFLALRGQNAMDAAQKTQDALDQAQQQARASLKTRSSQNMFDADSRRYVEMFRNAVSSHVRDQQFAWGIDTQSTSADVAQNWLAANPGDPQAYNNALDRTTRAYVKIASLGGDPKLGIGMNADDAVLKAKQRVAFTQVRSLLQNNQPDVAQKALASHMDVLGGLPETYGLEREVTGRLEDQMVGIWSSPQQQAAGGYGSPVVSSAGDIAGKPTLVQTTNAIWGFESGGNPNAPTSVQGAHGIGQVTPSFFKTYAHPGEDINNTKDTQAVSARGIADLYRRYNGDTARVATAYFSGPGNVAGPDSATAWKANLHDKLGTHVDQYVASVQKRLGGSGAPDQAATPPSIDDYLGKVRAAAQEAFPGDAGSVERVVKGVEANIKRDDSEQYSALEQQTRDGIAFLRAGGDPAKVSVTPAQLRAIGPRGTAAAEDLEAAFAFNKQYRALATAPQSQIDDILSGKGKPTDPTGAAYSEEDFKALHEAATKRQEEIFGNGQHRGDAATYAITNVPAVSAAAQKALGPNASPQDFDAYLKTLNGAYGMLGVPAPYRNQLPQPVVASMVTRLETAQPADAFKMLSGFSAESGAHWADVYADLVKGGLPAGYRTALSVAQTSPSDANLMIAAMQHDATLKSQGKDPMEKEAEGQFFNGKTLKETVDKALDPQTNTALQSLRESMGVVGRAGVDQFAGIQGAIKDTALYLVLSGSVRDPNQAVRRAVGMVVGPYDFMQQPGHPPVRLPKGSMGDFRLAGQYLLDHLTADELAPYSEEVGAHGEAVNLSEAERRQHALQGARHAYWVAVPGDDNQGAARAIDPTSGKPVMLKDGRPVDIAFSRIAARARGARVLAAQEAPSAQPTIAAGPL